MGFEWKDSNMRVLELFAGSQSFSNTAETWFGDNEDFKKLWMNIRGKWILESLLRKNTQLLSIKEFHKWITISSHY